MTSFERRPRLAAVIAVALAAGSFGGRTAYAQTAEHAVADVAQARELFIKAKEQRDSGDVKGALEKFKTAHALAQTPLTGLELGRTYRMAGMLLEAREEFLKVGRLPVTSEETTRSSEARREAGELAEQLNGRVPSVSIVVTGMPGDHVVVTIDGEVVPSAALLAPRLVNPGPHTIIARAGEAHDEARIELREGESKKVELKSAPQNTASPPSSPAPLPPAPEPPPAPSRTPAALMVVGFGVGGVGLIVGAITGGLALSKASSVNSACQSLSCPASAQSDVSSGRTMGNVSTAMFVIGGAGIVVGVVGVVLGRKTAPPADAAWIRPWMGAGSAGVTGSF